MISLFQIDQIEDEKLHTLKYSSGGVLSHKPQSAQTPSQSQSQKQLENNLLESKPSTNSNNVNTLNPSDLPFIDEDERELDEAIRQDNLFLGVLTRKPLEERQFQFVYLFPLLSNTLFKGNIIVQNCSFFTYIHTIIFLKN